MSQAPLIGGNVSQSELINQTNTAIRELNARDVTEIFKDDTGTRRVLLGKGKDGFYGLKVSKPGFDVYDSDGDDLAFNSDQNVFKIVDTGTLSLTHTIGGSGNVITTTESVAHGLSYTPALLAFITLDPGIMSGDLSNSTVPNPYPILYTLSAGATLTLMGQAEVYVDSTNVYFTLRTDGVSGGPYNCSAKYYLMQESFA